MTGGGRGYCGRKGRSRDDATPRDDFGVGRGGRQWGGGRGRCFGGGRRGETQQPFEEPSGGSEMELRSYVEKLEAELRSIKSRLGGFGPEGGK